MEETYIIILIIAVLILILYFVNFSGDNKGANGGTTKVNGGTTKVNGGTINQYKPYNPTEQFGICGSANQANQSTQANQATQITQSNQVSANNKATLKVHIAYWCGWSKKLIEQLGTDEFKNKFKDVENICVLEIIDCDANKEKCDPSLVKGFPTIILQSKSGKMILYNGNRSTDDLIAFIKANSA